MNVRLTSEAEGQAEACDAWWRENRDVRDDFVADADEIIVHAIWGASKEHGPRL